MRHLPVLPKWAVCVVLLLATALVYLPGLSGDFIFDDFPNIVANPFVHMERVDAESISRASRAYQPGVYGRPLATVWFGLDHLIGGKEPFAFKLSGLLVHLVNSLLVFFLVRALLALPSVNWSRPALAAGFITLLWAAHPLQISSVLYIVQRMETLAATFTLLGLLVYLRARSGPQGARVHWGLIVTSALLAAIGMLSKETAVLFPLFVLMLELTVLGFRGPDGPHRSLILVHAAVVASGLLLFALVIAPSYLGEAAYAGRDFTLWERLLTQPRALCLYLVQMLVPAPTLTTFYYDHFQASRGLLAPWTTLASLLALLGLAATAVVLRHRLPLYSLGVGWFFAAHALTSNVINLELVFEHRNYVALLGIVLASAAVLRVLAERRITPKVSMTLAALVVLGFGGLGAIRSATWGDPFNLAMELINLAPESSRAANDMATLYFGMSDANPNSPFFEFARYEFERSRALPNSSIIPEQGLILMAANAGIEINREWWDGMVEKIRNNPPSPEISSTLLGLIRQSNRGPALDAEMLRRAFSAYADRNRIPPEMHYAYGHFLIRSGAEVEELVGHMLAAIHNAEASISEVQWMAEAYAGSGHAVEADALSTALAQLTGN